MCVESVLTFDFSRPNTTVCCVNLSYNFPMNISQINIDYLNKITFNTLDVKEKPLAVETPHRKKVVCTGARSVNERLALCFNEI